MYEIPTLPALIDDARRGLLGDALDAPRRSDAEVFARVNGGGLYGVYGYAQWIARQLFPESCDEETLLASHAPRWLPNDGRKAAVAAAGPLKVRGAAGAVLPADVQLQRSDGGLFVVVDGVTLDASGQGVVTLRAFEPGYAGNTAAGIWLTLVQPQSGIESTLQVDAAGLVGGVGQEPIELLRQRVIDARRNGGQVGKQGDWELWAREVAGVTRAWAAPKLAGLGTVTVWVMRDGDADPFPDAAACDAVRGHLEASGYPAGEIVAVAPIDKPVPLTLRITPDTPALRAAVEAALSAAIAAQVAPIARDAHGAMLVPAQGVTLLRSHLTEAISTVPGELDHALLVPAGDVQCGIGELARLGVVTWTN